jgi:hypothetical protein
MLVGDKEVWAIPLQPMQPMMTLEELEAKLCSLNFKIFPESV